MGMMTQHVFQFEAAGFDEMEQDLADEPRSCSSEIAELRYASVKRVSLIFERSLGDRPCLTSTQESRDFFKRYWKDNPAWDQEQFVVACLDTKHRVQCVVRVTSLSSGSTS
jgi:hypothetical protein